MKADSMLRELKVEDAIGLVLAHDLTRIIPGEFKGRLFRKGHQIAEEDIPDLLSIGKEHIYVLELVEGYLHEDEAALRLANAVRGANTDKTEPHEGKVTLKSAIHGLAKIDKAFVDQVNGMGRIVMSTIRTNTVVQPGQALAGTRVIPLVIEEEPVARVERLAALRRSGGTLHADAGSLEPQSGGPAVDAARATLPAEAGPLAPTPVPAVNSAARDAAVRREEAPAAAAGLVAVKPFRSLRVGLITTGSEVFKGRIRDKFGPAVRAKVEALGSRVIDQRFTPDDMDAIVAEIRHFLGLGADLILVTGGMSVDPDDRTPGAISRAGARIVSYGTPMLPGSMLMMAYIGSVPVMGLPGCVMHDPYTSFDVLLPRICAGEEIFREDITEMGYGGLLGC
ncbi:molybdopterin-binding protein [Paenibacillus sp. UNC499MF]|uniref:molybdopterin-binding protein n=1 Tax=Paenibacillus sp. UNC499MF TaxID=1502751 RepID=UPI00089FBBC3|nr:molybdopterin-binding protein [Paenibacillus sp. UNC499MF]SEG70164.1 molybdenum cofactor synthesis domain-containing protein [Paenibacillus sp. UNC499MF]